MINSLLMCSFVISAIIQLGFWLLIFSRIKFYKEKTGHYHEKNVSVIIAAKNEEKNISACLQAISKEKDTIAEIIVVDDYSTDNTPSIIQEHQKVDDRITYLKANKNVPGKKLALTEAIQKSISPIILLTDADCIPASKHWASLLASKLTPAKNIVLAYSPIRRKKSLVNLWARFETWITGVQYLSLALTGMPYMGVGRNLMYKKSVFSKADGFNRHKNLISGDDDLFVNHAGNKFNTTISLDPRSYVYTESPHSFRQYFIQKMRHVSVSHKYKNSHIAVLSLFSLSHIMFYLCAIALLFIGDKKIVPFIFLVLAVKWFIAFLNMKKMKETMWPLFPFLDIALAFYYIIMSPFLFIRNKTW